MEPKTVIERLGLLACLLVGCRAVIGVEDLHVAGDAGPELDGSVDAVATSDAGGDSASDAAGDTATAGDAAKPDLGACGAWCKTDGGLGDAAATFYSDMKSCMCQGSVAKACTTECPGFCPSGVPSSSTCETCVLQQAFGNGGVCVAKASNCTGPCLTFGQCVKSCQ